MIRVLNIVETISSGGVERRRLSLAKLLDKSKFELKIICTNYKGGIIEEIKSNNVEVFSIGKLNSPLDYGQHKKVMKIIDDFKPHIIHGAVFEGVIMAAVSGFFKRVPIVIIEETSDPIHRTWRGNFLMKLFSSISDKVIGVSPAATDYLKKINIANDKIVLITNGVVIPEILSTTKQLELRAKYGIEKGEIVIGSVGRMLQDEHKRFSDLIKAFAPIAKNGIKAKLLLVGEGPERVSYEKLVCELAIADKVIFAGYQDKISDFYSIFDIFSLVSGYEAFGLVLAEAMLHKLPIVGSRVGGIQYIVDDQVTGYLVERFDVEAISDRLKSLCLNEELRLYYGNNGYKKAMKDYTEERYVKDIESLYLNLCKTRWPNQDL